jgi:Recombinase
MRHDRFEQHAPQNHAIISLALAAERESAQITELQASGATSLRAIASALNDRAIPTARGGKWFAASVRDVLARI